VTGDIRNAFGFAFFFDTTESSVRNSFDGGGGNSATDRVRNAAVLHFLLVAGAIDFSSYRPGTPDAFTTDRAGTLFFDDSGFTRFISAAATLGIPGPLS